jgi:hypothetical protein
MMLDAERSEARSARCALPRAETPRERGPVADAAGLRDDDAPSAAPLTPPAAAPAPCARRSASPSSGVRGGGPRSRGRRAPRRAGPRTPPPARCWHTLATVDEQAALELPSSGDVGAGGAPLDSRAECALCRARRRCCAERRAPPMSDQEPGLAAATSGGSTPSLPSSGATTGPTTPPRPAELPRAGGGAAAPALDVQTLIALLKAAEKLAADEHAARNDAERHAAVEHERGHEPGSCAQGCGAAHRAAAHLHGLLRVLSAGTRRCATGGLRSQRCARIGRATSSATKTPLQRRWLALQHMHIARRAACASGALGQQMEQENPQPGNALYP